MRALAVAPRVSGGVAHAMAVGVLCRSSERLWSVPESAANQVHMCARNGTQICPDNPVPLVRDFPGPELTRSVGDDAAGYGVCGAVIASHSGLSMITWPRCMRWPSRDSMFDLCSAPYKALRSLASLRPRGARPVGLDGACAQIASGQLRDGRRMNAARRSGRAIYDLIPAVRSARAITASDSHIPAVRSSSNTARGSSIRPCRCAAMTTPNVPTTSTRAPAHIFCRSDRQ